MGKRGQDLTEDEMKTLRAKAEKFGLRNSATLRKQDMARDFGSYVIIEAYHNRLKFLRWMLTDFLRQTFGRGPERQKAAHTMESLDAPIGNSVITAGMANKSTDATIKAELLHYQRQAPADQDRFWEMLPKKLDKVSRMILMLHYKWGMTHLEIGDLMDVTESRVCQLHTQAIKNIIVLGGFK